MKKRIFTLIFVLTCSLAFTQVWNLPLRNTSAPNGTQFVATITSLSLSARENLILQEILNGNVPSFYRNLKPVTSYATINSQLDSVLYYVIPDYMAVGHDTDYFLCPMSPMCATQIGDSTGCTLPTRKMVNDIYAAATVKLNPQTIAPSGQMTTVPVFADHDSMVWSQRSALIGTYPLGELTGGDKKDVVISNIIYNTANRVVIYGWHTSIGNPIQPMTNVHADTYMDYSHGLRMVQNACIHNGSATTVKAILQSSTLNSLLSDEGVISQPQYPYSNVVSSLSTPVSFAVINNTANQLEIKVSNDVNATHYNIYTSANGVTFNPPQTLPKNNLLLTGLTSGQTYFVKIESYNQNFNVTSSVSEVLAAVPCAWQDSVLIVNGFDRASTGNTCNFVIQHGTALKNKNYNFSSATNEAVETGLILLSNYKSADWILGKESSVNETFSSAEQTLVSGYLNSGGFLFASGSEIGWDLDHLGSAADKSFYNNYLKSSYVSDAPNNQASTFYSAINSGSGVFSFANSLNFDNGTHGTYNVDYPDVITPLNGSAASSNYSSSVTDYASVHFTGNFPNGTTTGKLIYLAFPFETIYPSAMRDTVMGDAMNYFFPSVALGIIPITIGTENNFIVYPNPSAGKFFVQAKNENYEVSVFNSLGEKVFSASNFKQQTTGDIDLSSLPDGIYFVHLKTGLKTAVQKVIIQK